MPPTLWSLASALLQNKVLVIAVGRLPEHCAEVQSRAEAQKKYTCILCEVYQLYHRTTASAGKRIRDEFPEQDVKYNTMLRDRMKNR